MDSGVPGTTLCPKPNDLVVLGERLGIVPWMGVHTIHNNVELEPRSWAALLMCLLYM